MKFYAHYINAEAMSQLQNLEEQTVSHLGITPDELKGLMLGTADALERTSVTEKIDEVVNRAKNFPPKKSVAMVLSVCEDILTQSMDTLSSSEREVLLGVLAQYTAMKRQIAEHEKTAMAKKQGVRER